MKVALGALAGLALGLSAAGAAAADWIKAESENFVFYGEVKPETATEMLEELELFRGTVMTMMGAERSPEVRKVHVFGEPNARGVQKLTGRGGIAGIYTNANDYPLFVTIANGSSRNRSDMMVSLHELSHHIIHGHRAQFYPRWYDEGFAEYLSTFRVEEDTVVVGDPSSSFGPILNRRGWTDIDKVLGAVAEYPFESGGHVQGLRAGYFYAMSWLSVHKILSTPELGRHLGDYVAAINEGRDAKDAFEGAFGMSTKDFRREIGAYWRADAFPVTRFKITDALADTDVTVTAIPETEALIAQSEVRATFTPAGRDRERAKARTAALLAEAGPDARLYNSLMLFSLTRETADEAVAIGERAVAALPDDPLALQTLADALYHRWGMRGRRRDDASLRRAITLFERQLALEPTNPTANGHLPDAYIQSNTKPTQTVVNAVAFNLAYKPSPSQFMAYLDGAEVMGEVGADEERCALLGTVAPWIIAADETLSEEQRKQVSRRGETPRQRLDRLATGYGARCDRV